MTLCDGRGHKGHSRGLWCDNIAGVGQTGECGCRHLHCFAANKISSQVGSVCAGSQSSSSELREVI